MVHIRLIDQENNLYADATVKAAPKLFRVDEDVYEFREVEENVCLYIKVDSEEIDYAYIEWESYELVVSDADEDLEDESSDEVELDEDELDDEEDVFIENTEDEGKS